MGNTTRKTVACTRRHPFTRDFNRKVSARSSCLSSRNVCRMNRIMQKEFVVTNQSNFVGPTDESNWIIPGKLLVGAYPIGKLSCSLASFYVHIIHIDLGEAGDQLRKNEALRAILGEGVTAFVCLQEEYEHDLSKVNTRYHPYILDAWSLCEANDDLPDSSKIRLLHLPIRDCSCTESKKVFQLCVHLAYTLLLNEKHAMYIHCWGGMLTIGVSEIDCVSYRSW